MKTVISLCGLALLSTSVVAQQPSVRTRLGTTADPSGPARGWSLASDPDSTADLAPMVEGRGPGVRIQTPSALTVVRAEWELTGTFTVSAIFQRTSASDAVYGLTVGTRDALNPGMAFLVRANGAVSIAPVASESRNWTTSRVLRSVTAEGVATDRLEVRVNETVAEFVVNGSRVASMRIDSGALDGRPGVHVGPGGELLVAAFSVEAPTAVLTPMTR